MYLAMYTPSKINNSLSWLIGGAQGSGLDSAANIFSRACAQGGLHVFGKREYYSNRMYNDATYYLALKDIQIPDR
jgi:Pyruvate/2-oxoacid:ferredoxin oxidoreductase gamma subunit